MNSRQRQAIGATLSGVSRLFRFVTFAALAGVLALVGVSPAAQARSGPGLKTYPMPPRAVPEQLSAAAQAQLPALAPRVERILGDEMDQDSLLPVQLVSAWHILGAFRKNLGAAAFRSAVRISWRESRLLPNVVNDTNRDGTNDWGLFQLNDGGTLQAAGGEPGEAALRPRWNARAAARLVSEVGWGPWGGMIED